MSHNKRLLEKYTTPQETKRSCNCQKLPCPLGGNCLSQDIIYEATITTASQVYNYIGLTVDTFKKRYQGHLSTFNNPKYRTSTRLSEKVWEMKESNTPFKTTWKIVRRGKSYSGGSRTCDLCLTEKVEILLRSKDPKLLNSRNELLGKCRHRRKFTLETTMANFTKE